MDEDLIILDRLFKITFTLSEGNTYTIGDGTNDTVIVDGSMILDEMIADGNIRLGDYISNKFEFKALGLEMDVTGLAMRVEVVENGATRLLFYGKVDSVKTDRFSLEKHVVSYDIFYSLRDINIANFWNIYWQNPEHLRISTLKDFRTALCNYMEIPVSTSIGDLPNDGFNIYPNLQYSILTFGECLRMICELQGTIPNINRSGTLSFIRLGGGNLHDIINRDEANNTSYDFIVSRITGFAAFREGEDIILVGTNENEYDIVDNIFIENASSEEAIEAGLDNLLNAFKFFAYRSATIPMIVSDFTILPGDRLNTERGLCYALAQTFSGPALVEQNIRSVASSRFLVSNAKETTVKE